MILSILAGNANADVEVSVTGPASIRMYSERNNDERLDRRNLEDDMDVESKAITYTITNTGTENLTNIKISAEDINSRYDAVVEFENDENKSFVVIDELLVGESEDVQINLKATIPGVNGNVDYPDLISGPDVTVSMGSLSMSGENEEGNEAFTKNDIDVFFENEPFLELERIIIYVNGQEKENLRERDRGDTVENIKPGDEVDVEIFISNRIDDRVSDDKIEDIMIYILANEMDDGYDFDEDDDIRSLRGEERDSVRFSFIVPEEIEANDYEVLLYNMEGEDEFGNLQTIADFDFEIEIERERNKIEIKDATINPSMVRCNDRSARVFIEIQNTGERDQDRAAINIENAALGISIWDRDIDELITIEDDRYDSRYSSTYTIRVPEDADEGTYYLSVNAYFDNNILSDTLDIPLVFEGCEPEEDEDDEEDNDTTTPPVDEDEVVPDPVDVFPPTDDTDDEDAPEEDEDVKDETPPVTGIVTGLRGSPLYTSLLILANVLLVVLIVGVGVKLLRKD
ncbi:MAG: hypothetical protein ACLFUO_00890 [Candidatus Woesearchaeota archaeon]